jgi:hypothetical protein
MMAMELFAQALRLDCSGPHRCVFCGAKARHPYELPETFTERARLAYPESRHICVGCKVATKATAGQSPEGKPWMWSWVITRGRAQKLALCPMLGGERVREGRAWLLETCLDPPPAPYVIALCPSGRTHTLYRCAVHLDGPGATANIDGQALWYEPKRLRAMVDLCRRLAQRYGILVVRERQMPPARRIGTEADELADLDEWQRCRTRPLAQLAALLVPAPET